MGWTGPINKSARKQAAEWGFQHDKNPPFDTHGQLAFRKGNIWITPDKDGHGGGFWKWFQGKHRMGTLSDTGKYIRW